MSSRNFFNEIAKEWHTMRQAFFSERIRDKAYEVAKVKSGDQTADIGAGTGFITEGLLNLGAAVIAVDESEEMLKELMEKHKSVNLQTVLGESMCLPVNSNSVDHAFANMYLHHVPDPEKAVNEMARIVKSNGKVIITDLDSHQHEFLRHEQHDRWLGFERDDIKKWFENAGLQSVKVSCLDESCCCKSECEDEAAISIFIAEGTKR